MQNLLLTSHGTSNLREIKFGMVLCSSLSWKTALSTTLYYLSYKMVTREHILWMPSASATTTSKPMIKKNFITTVINALTFIGMTQACSLQDGVTIGHLCCTIHNLSKHLWSLCPAHTATHTNKCAIIACSNDALAKSKVCHLTEHNVVECTYQLRG